MKLFVPIGIIIAIALLVGTLERRWQIESNPPTQEPRSARPGTDANYVRSSPASAGLLSPCTWISRSSFAKGKPMCSDAADLTRRDQ